MMRKFASSLAALCLLLLSHCVLPAESTICWIDPSDDFHDRMPLILRANGNDFVYPSKCGSKSLRLTFQDNLRAACPGDTITVLGSNTNLAEAKLSCYGITLFGIGGSSFAGPFRQIRCNRVPEAEVQSTARSCGNGTISRIGFALSDGSFASTIEEVCSDVNQTYWTHHKVVPNLVKRSKLPILGGAGGDKEDGFLGGWGGWWRPSTTTTTTTTTAPTLEQIITANFVPREDMFYRAQQDSTQLLAGSSLPMYRSVRNGNWRLVEDIVRKLASRKGQCSTLDVWTGRYNGTNNSTGESTTTTTPPSTVVPLPTTTTQAPSTTDPLPTTTTTTTTTTPAPSTSNPLPTTTTTTPAPPMPNNRDSRQLPSPTTAIPRFVFKMVVDQQHSRGIVFVTLNDPTVTAVTASEQLCAPYKQCENLYPQFTFASRGYTHCCTLADFAGVAAELGIPAFPSYQPIV